MLEFKWGDEGIYITKWFNVECKSLWEVRSYLCCGVVYRGVLDFEEGKRVFILGSEVLELRE